MRQCQICQQPMRHMGPIGICQRNKRCKNAYDHAVRMGRGRTPQAIAREAERREAVAQIKLEAGCVDCGYRAHAAALDFDHLPGFEKRKGIADLMDHAWEIILAEITKCEVRCANCHRIKTAERRGGEPCARAV